MFVQAHLHVVGFLLRAVVAGKAAVESEDIPHVRGEGRPVVLQFGLMPHSVRIVQQRGVGHVFFFGDGGKILVVAHEQLDLPPILGRQFVPVREKRFRRFGHLAAGHDAVILAGQIGKRLASARRGGGRCGRNGIIAQHAHGVIQCVSFPDLLPEGGEGFLCGHGQGSFL